MKKLSFLLIFLIASTPAMEARKLTDKSSYAKQPSPIRLRQGFVGQGLRRSRALADMTKKIAIGVAGGIVSVLFVAGAVYRYKKHQRRARSQQFEPSNAFKPILDPQQSSSSSFVKPKPAAPKFDDQKTNELFKIISKQSSTNQADQIGNLITEKANPNRNVCSPTNGYMPLLEFAVNNDASFDNIRALVKGGAHIDGFIIEKARELKRPQELISYLESKRSAAAKNQDNHSGEDDIHNPLITGQPSGSYRAIGEPTS